MHDTVKILAQTPHFLLEVVPVDRIAWLTRSPVVFESEAQVDATFGVVNTAMDRLGRQRHGLLVDLRAGPFSTMDPATDQQFQEKRRLLMADFPVIAVVTKTAVGRLQVMRHAHEEGQPVKAFDSIEAARAHLQKHWSNAT